MYFEVNSRCLLRESYKTQRYSPYLTANSLRLRYEPNRLMLFRETVGVYCENHTEHTDTLCGSNAEFLWILEQMVHVVAILL
jgi:hypothetical protein